MTKRTTAGVVIIMLHLLQRCSTTNVTTTVKTEETSTSGTLTSSTTEQIPMTNDTKLPAGEYSDGYVQNTAGVSATTTTASLDRSEQVANASPTTQYPKMEELSSHTPPQPTKEDETSSVPNNTTNPEHSSTLFPIQNTASSSSKPSDELVSSSKVNKTSSDDEMDVSDFDSDAPGSIAENQAANANETETQSNVTDKGQIQNEAATSPSDDLRRNGMKIGAADVRDDDAYDFENFSEPSSAINKDYDVEKNGTSKATPMQSDNTTNPNINDKDGMEIMLLADDMVEQYAQGDSRSISSDDAVNKLPAEVHPMPQSETAQSVNTSNAGGSSDIDNTNSSRPIYASNFNGTDEKSDVGERFNLPSSETPSNDFGIESTHVQQQTNSDGMEVPSDIHNVSNTEPENDSASPVSESFGGFEDVHLLADDISLDSPEGENTNLGNNTGEHSASDQKPFEETIDDKTSHSEFSSSGSDGITAECNTSACQNSDNQTNLNNAGDVHETDESYTPIDQENMSNLQNTSVGAPYGNDSQPVAVNENNSPSLNVTVGDTPAEAPVNDSVNPDVPSNMADEEFSEQTPVTERDNVGSSMDVASPSATGSESQVPEVDEDMPLSPVETQTPQEYYSTPASQREMTQVKEVTTEGQMLNKTFTVPRRGMLEIHLKMDRNPESTSAATDPQMPQDHPSMEDDDKVDENFEPAQQERAGDVVEVLADDFIFGEDGKGTDEDISPMEENSKDPYITTTLKPYFITESHEPNPSSAKCPFSAKIPDSKIPKQEQQRTVEHRPEGQIVEDPYFYELDPFCLTRHHVLIPAVPVILPQWCFVPDTPDFMCPRYDLGFHIAFAHETQRDMYYRCVYGQAVLLKCPNLHYWDDDRKICTLMTDFSHYQRHRYHQSRNLYDQTTHHHCQHCRRNFLLPQDLDPSAQCSDRMLLACNTDGTLSVYECPGFYYYDRQIQLRWYADLERCDYPTDGDGPWH